MSQEIALRSVQKETSLAIIKDVVALYGGSVVIIKEPGKEPWLKIDVPGGRIERCVREIIRQEELYESRVLH